MNPHLFVDISSHGFGHLAQTAPVLAELRRRLPNLHLTVRCGLAKRQLLTRIAEPFTHIREMSDVGFIQHDAVRIDHDATRAAYEALHIDWADRVAQEADFLRRLQPNLVLSNVAYLPLAGARQAGIPAFAMSSLCWLPLARHFYGQATWAGPMLMQMAEAYGSATGFIAFRPSIPLEITTPVHEAGTVARVAAEESRARVRASLDMGTEDRLVLVAMGGYGLNLPIDDWPERPGLHYLLSANWDVSHPSALTFTEGEYDFTELLRASDAILTKPGYGTMTEAACNGTPLLYLRRDDWPEQDYLIDWLQQAGGCREVAWEGLRNGRWLHDLDALLAEPVKPPAPTMGAAEAAELLLAYLQ